MDIKYRMACKVYGIRPLEQKEETQLSDGEKIVRQCKIDIVNMCNSLRKKIDEYDSIAVTAEEKKNNKDKMMDLRSKVRKVVEVVNNNL